MNFNEFMIALAMIFAVAMLQQSIINRAKGVNFDNERYLTSHLRFDSAIYGTLSEYEQASEQASIAAKAALNAVSPREKLLACRALDKVDARWRFIQAMFTKRAAKDRAVLYHFDPKDRMTIELNHRKWGNSVEKINAILGEHRKVKAMIYISKQPQS